MSKKIRMIRQGDVFLHPIDELPKGLKIREDKRLALGESTGHAHHLIDGEVFVDENGVMYVQAAENTTLQHLKNGIAPAEHHTKTLIPNKAYRVVIQREYEPEGFRAVQD
jgi:hypothetical protein